jgi:hypothetical protein
MDRRGLAPGPLAPGPLAPGPLAPLVPLGGLAIVPLAIVSRIDVYDRRRGLPYAKQPGVDWGR